MTEDPDRDGDLIRKLGERTAPDVPADLAARIVRQVTQLPQQSAPVAVPQAEMPSPETASPEPLAPLTARSRASTRRWLPRAVGGAVAACAIGALLLHVVTLSQGTLEAPVRESAAPAPAPVKVVTGPVEVRIAAASEAPAAIAPVARKSARPAAAVRRKATPPSPARSVEVPLEVEDTPEFVIQEVAPAVPSHKPVEQAVVGPADPHGMIGPMPRSGPAPGFGISGAGGMPGAPRF